jgi:uncharacterized Rmd1/YagE family protein
MDAPLGTRDRIVATAWLLGEGLEPRPVAGAEVLARAPLTLRTKDDGLVVLFRFGAAVVFRPEDGPSRGYPESLRPLVRRPFASPESDDAEIRVAREEPEGPDREGFVVVAEASLDRLQVVADVLARSAFLAHFEARLSSSIDRLEPLAEQLRRGARGRLSGRRLLRELGEVLVSEMRMVGRVEVSEKPERVWDRPELDRLYVRLAEEYELEARDHAVTRKFDLLGRSANNLLDMLASRRSLHVEWYIVILILVEIVILVYDLATR